MRVNHEVIDEMSAYHSGAIIVLDDGCKREASYESAELGQADHTASERVLCSAVRLF